MGCNSDNLLQIDAGPQGPQGIINPALPTYFNLEIKIITGNGIVTVSPWTVDSLTEVSKVGNVWKDIDDWTTAVDTYWGAITIANMFKTQFTNNSFNVFIDRKIDVLLGYSTWPAQFTHFWTWGVDERGINSFRVKATDVYNRQPIIFPYGTAPQIQSSTFSLLITTT